MRGKPPWKQSKNQMHQCLVNFQRAGKAPLSAKLPAHIYHSFRGCKISTSRDQDFSKLRGLPSCARTGSPAAAPSLPWHSLSWHNQGTRRWLQPAAGTQLGKCLLRSHRDTWVTMLQVPLSFYSVGAMTCEKVSSWRSLIVATLTSLRPATAATAVRDFSLSFHPLLTTSPTSVKKWV